MLLSNVTGGATIQDGLGVVTIVDNDVAPPRGHGRPLPTGAEGAPAVIVTFTRTGVTSAPLAVNVGRGGTASARDVARPPWAARTTAPTS